MEQARRENSWEIFLQIRKEITVTLFQVVNVELKLKVGIKKYLVGMNGMNGKGETSHF